MSERPTLRVEARSRAGKGAARAVRREGKIPAVIYGDKKDPETVAIDFPQLIKHIKTGRFTKTLYDLDLDGKKTRVIPRDVQFHPVNDKPLHVDFLRLGPGSVINVFVPVHFLNEEASPGLKKGGVLNVVRHEVELYVPADAIPDAIEADLTGTQLGDSIHISAIPLPKGVKPVIHDRDFTVATIAKPSGLAVSDDDEGDEEGGEETEGEGGEE